MKIRTLATSSADGRALNTGSILELSGKLAGICQDTKNFVRFYLSRLRILNYGTNTKIFSFVY